MLNPIALRKLLRSFIDAVCDEADRNPALAERLGELFAEIPSPTPRPRTREAALDPFRVLAAKGTAGLREMLADLDARELRKIIQAHRLDASGLSKKWKVKQRLIDLIVERVEARAKQGDVFREYKSHSEQGQEGQPDPSAKSRRASDVKEKGDNPRAEPNGSRPPSSIEQGMPLAPSPAIHN